jgi:hypothetical protein
MADPIGTTVEPGSSRIMSRPSDIAASDSRLVYRKTEAGDAEVMDRALGLSVGARRLIILIDGQRPLSDLPSFARQGDLPALLEELESRGLIALAGIADAPTLEELAARMQAEQVKLQSIKQALDQRFEQILGVDGIVLDARVADCVSLDVFKRILREAINLLQQRGLAEHAQSVIGIARASL